MPARRPTLAPTIPPEPSTRPTFADLDLAGERCLLVASSGGHLAQMVRIAGTLDLHPDSQIVTFPGQQADSLDLPFAVRTIRYIAPRDAVGTLRATRWFADTIRRGKFRTVVSTGAAVAVAALPVAAVQGARALYIESYSRFRGPSASGRMLARVPRVERYTQHREWASPRWSLTGSIIDTIRPLDPDDTRDHRPAHDTGHRARVFVTLGTIRPYRFDALIDRVLQITPPDADIVWQTGATTRTDLPGEVHEQLSRRDFLAAATSSDVVISHAGTGTTCELVERGIRPVLVPRRAVRGEHVDDHQLQIASDFAERDLVSLREVDELSSADLGLVPAA